MSEFKNIGANELGLLAALIGIALACDKTPDEQNILGNFIVGIGCIILVIASQAQYLASLEDKKNGIDTEELKRQILELQKQINEIKNQDTKLTGK
jgi:hypothetical protein